MGDSKTLPEAKQKNVTSNTDLVYALSVQKQAIGYEPDKNFLEMFNEQVSKRGEANAILTEQGSFTYKELNSYSDRLAFDLKESGIKKRELIGLSTETNTLLIVGILGILKAGGVYLPLDPEYPTSRLNYILEDSSPKMILTQKKFKSLYTGYSVQILQLREALPDFHERNFLPSISLDDPAYVVYTSGTTNNPNGIIVSHRSLPNIGIAHRGIYPSYTKSLISGGICFDASILAIFHTLLNGGSLCVFAFTPDLNFKNLCDFIESQKINFLICVPSLYEKILHACLRLDNLLCVSLTGEMLPTGLCLRHSECVPNASLYNEYGPTECAIGTTAKEIYNPVKKEIYRTSVGFPLPNTRIYILDEDLQLCLTGKKGEIYIDSVGLAIGYLNKDKLTNEKFKKLHLSGNREVRLYKTGDLGRYLENGEIEFLGRIEYHTILNGQKVYFGEIENAISLYPKVKGMVVFESESKLVACITSILEDHIEENLRNFLNDLLPIHMIPEKIICLERFPLSPNGKVDRQALLEYLAKPTSITDYN